MTEQKRHDGGAGRRRQKKEAERRAEKRSQPKKKKQWKISRGGCIARVLLLLLIVLACYFFLQTSLFRLQEIDIKGLNAIKEDEIITLSGISLGANIFQVDRPAAEKQIRLHALVADVAVKTRPPHRILIEVNERTGIASFLFEGEYYTVDAEGYVIAKSAQANVELPLLTGAVLPEAVSVGQALPMEALKGPLTVAAALKDRYPGMQVEIDAGEAENYRLFLDRMEVQLGGTWNLIGKLNVLDSLLLTISEENKEKVEYINVTAPSKPVVKWKSGDEN